MGNIEIRLSDLTKYPGSGLKEDSEFSGEWFFEEHLDPAFEKAIKNNLQVLIDFDHVVVPYNSSFLIKAFGSLAKKYSKGAVLQHLGVISIERPMLEAKIKFLMSIEID